MKVLVIPDVHLKPLLFLHAAEIMRRGTADRAVCLMDIPDDWHKEKEIELYKQTYDAAIAFAKEFPDTKWCYGNHDLSYIWGCLESGFSAAAFYTVQEKLMELQDAMPQDHPIQYVHQIDHVLFSHGGISQDFVEMYFPESRCKDVEEVTDGINRFGSDKMWQEDSPIWLRPQHTRIKMYMSEEYLQVVGHTPVEKIEREGNVISCDVFSTYQNGHPVGTQEFLLLDTQSWEFSGVSA